jgi:osmoprotectant transport system substrate-binding protein
MKAFRTLCAVLVLATLIGACAPAPTPAPTAAPAAKPAAPAAPTAAPAAPAAPTAAPTAVATKAPTAAPAAPTAAPAPTTAATAAPAAASGGTVKVGSKDFTEELLLGEMYALVLEANGIKVERKLNLAGTQVAHEALMKGEIDLYPEYTGTGYLFILDIKDGEKDPAKVFQATAAEYEKRFKLTWLQASPMNDTNAVAVTKAAADKYSLKTLSDLSKAAPNLRMAAIPDFEQRPDGLAGLKKLYGGFEFKSLTVYDPGLKYKAVADDKADAVIAFSTDAKIAALKLVVMQDDKSLWPPYQVAPVVRDATLAANPAIKDALNKLAPMITTDVITQLNSKVDEEKQEYAAVAKAFLKEKGLIK